MQPSVPQPFPVVSVAKFSSLEEAEAFHALAAECGVDARISSTRRFSTGFDATLGGSDSLEGYAVKIHPADVPALRAHLAATLQLDPMDPMHSAGRAELQGITEGPVDGNLCEQVIAAKILESLPPESTTEPIQPQPVDGHLERDRRLARWLGGTGLVFTAIYASAVLGGIHFAGEVEDAHYLPEYVQDSFSYAMPYHDDGISRNMRPLLITLVPMATGAALILSWRQLRDGTRRRMFPPVWRLTGQLLFWLPALVMASLLVYVKVR